MKATGIVRKLDTIARLVIPTKLRRMLEIDDKTKLEIHVDSDLIILQKYKPSCTCIFCWSEEEVYNFKDRNICKKCLEIIRLNHFLLL